MVLTNVFGSVTSSPAILTVAPLTLTAPSIPASGEFQFGFDTANGVNHEVEYSTDLINWYPALSIGGNGMLISVIDPNAASSPHRYYRIIQTLP